MQWLEALTNVSLKQLDIAVELCCSLRDRDGAECVPRRGNQQDGRLHLRYIVYGIVPRQLIGKPCQDAILPPALRCNTAGLKLADLLIMAMPPASF